MTIIRTALCFMKNLLIVTACIAVIVSWLVFSAWIGFSYSHPIGLIVLFAPFITLVAWVLTLADRNGM